MEVHILINQNPFFANSATANRWLTLLEGLAALNTPVKLWITGGYQTATERENAGLSGKKNGVQYTYLHHWVNDTLWKRRWHQYVLRHWQQRWASWHLSRIHWNNHCILWTENDLLLWKLAHKLAARNKQLKLFAEMSEFLDIHHFNIGNKLQKMAGDKKQRYFERKYLYALSGFALMTHRLLEHYSAFSGRLPALMHLPMTVDLERFEAKQAPVNDYVSPYLLFVGVMNDAKDGVNLLIQAFAQVAPSFPDHKLYLVGGWNYDTPAHLELIDRLGMQKRIFWQGEVSRNTIPALLQHAELLVLPRPDSKQAQGGFPTKLGEYLASGKPVVATRVGELPRYLEDGESVFFCQPGSTDSLTDALNRALSSPSLMRQVGLNGREVAKKHFNKNIQSKLLKEFFEQMFIKKPLLQNENQQ